MQDFTRLLSMIDYVDRLPTTTVFDYSNHDCCMFGLGVNSPEFAEVKDHYKSGKWIEFKHYMGVTEEQFEVLYSHLFSSLYGKERLNKTAVCEAARQKVLMWQETQLAQVLEDKKNGKCDDWTWMRYLSLHCGVDVQAIAKESEDAINLAKSYKVPVNA